MAHTTTCIPNPSGAHGKQPRPRSQHTICLKVRLTAFPESNGKRNWTALLVRFDIGDFDDEEPKRSHKKPVYKRVKCPHCDKHPKERGLADHIRAVHRISKVKQAINSQGIPTHSNLASKEDL